MQALDTKILHHIWTPDVDLQHAKATNTNQGFSFLSTQIGAYQGENEMVGRPQITP